MPLAGLVPLLNFVAMISPVRRLVPPTAQVLLLRRGWRRLAEHRLPEAVRPGTTPAVLHPRNHVEPHETAVFLPTDLLHHALVVVDRVLGRMAASLQPW